MGLGDKTVHIVIGTKAQLIKMAPVMIELDRQEIGYNFIFTGQHKETINELMNVFGLREPDHYLYKGKDITKITEVPKWFLSSLWKLVKHNDKYGIKKNDIILVHGDTFSTVLGALVGKLSSCKVGHVESGLRSFNIFAPFPEELNRLITFGLSDYYFCPGKWAIDNLKGYKGIKINTEVNTLFDSLQLAKKNLNKVNIDIPANKYVLVSLHRFENIYNKKSLKKNIEIIEKVAEKFKVLFILHEPTKQNLNKFDFYERLQRNPNIELRPRYDYFRFIKFLINSEFVMTDGGSNQEESYYLGKPCLLLRSGTERKEGIGKNGIISKYDKEIVKDFLNDYKKYEFNPSTLGKSPSKILVGFLGGY